MTNRIWLVLMLGLLLGGCGGNSSGDGSGEDPEATLDPNIPPVTGGSWYQPALLSTWQWQLQGTINTGYDVDIYDIDLEETPVQTIADLHAAGRKVICYFSAGSYEEWRSDAGDFAGQDLGRNLDGWPGERWLDIRSDGVFQIMLARLDTAVAKGCDGVEPDNVDGYANDSGFALAADDQLAYNRMIANAAHERGLAVALKNDLDQVPALVNYFDFAVNEECMQYSECDVLAPFVAADKPMLHVEYDSRYVNNASNRSALCDATAAMQFSTLILPLDLDDSFRFSCQ